MPTKKKLAEPVFDLAKLSAAEGKRFAGHREAEPLAKAVVAAPKAITAKGGYLPVARKSGLFARPPAEVRRKMDAWSYSRYKDWLQCPYKAFLKHVLKIREPGSPAMDRGNHAHKVAEDLLLGKITWEEARVLALEAGDKSRFGPKAKPISLQNLRKDFDLAARSKPTVEEQWGFAQDWSEAGWFGDSTWLRAKLDLCYLTKKGHMRVVDHKSGQKYADHAEQADLYALTTFIKFPNVTDITVEYWYFDLGEKTFAKFKRSEMPTLIERWENKVRPMMNDTTYPCRPGPYCRWCFHSKYTAGGSGKCEN
jgi:hypothetical protein